MAKQEEEGMTFGSPKEFVMKMGGKKVINRVSYCHASGFLGIINCSIKLKCKKVINRVSYCHAGGSLGIISSSIHAF